MKVKDNSSIAITKLSSGEKQKAILDIANSLLKKNNDNNSEKYIIFGFDEPESSLHISACFDMFQDLYETTHYCSQVLFTTHWYGYIPSVVDGNTVILTRDSQDNHAFDFINIEKYREDTKILKDISQNKLPINIQLKSINDLVQAIIYGSMSENPFNWLICEGSSEKIYLSYFLDDLIDDKRLRILPVGGYSEVKKLYNHLSIDFLHKSFFNQFNCLSFTQSKLYMPASKLNRRFNLLRRFLYTQDKILKHFILPNTCST